MRIFIRLSSTANNFLFSLCFERKSLTGGKRTRVMWGHLICSALVLNINQIVSFTLYQMFYFKYRAPLSKLPVSRWKQKCRRTDGHLSNRLHRSLSHTGPRMTSSDKTAFIRPHCDCKAFPLLLMSWLSESRITSLWKGSFYRCFTCQLRPNNYSDQQAVRSISLQPSSPFLQ